MPWDAPESAVSDKIYHMIANIDEYRSRLDSSLVIARSQIEAIPKLIAEGNP